ncbi:acyl-CoA N-acyltransferase [Mycena albidolilacea]|uniref:Acyl-CoA N-acyltransferase n=1 Tax=Mycena albidolilacea TaxID=1033008 RepID=A0AAD6ZGX7_9AGAR|nr:acyl-CoA N-acyltransferase [Mycena albidolilacea]
MTFSIVPAVKEDIPRFSEIFTAAFTTDSHTLVKAQADGLPMGTVEMSQEWWRDLFDLPEKAAIIKAVEDESGKTLGACGWGKWNFDGSKPALAEGEADPRAEGSWTEPLPADHKPIDVLKKIGSDSMNEWVMKLNQYGKKNMYIFGISVDPVEQGKGIGSALLKFGTDLCDEHQCYAWVHASMAGYPVFRKAGFKEIGKLELNLDDYADGVKWVKDGEEQDWGTYTFRYCKYEPKPKA